MVLMTSKNRKISMRILFTLMLFLLTHGAYSMDTEESYELKVHKTPHACPYCAHAHDIKTLDEYRQSDKVALHFSLNKHLRVEHSDLQNKMWTEVVCAKQTHLKCTCPACNMSLQRIAHFCNHFWTEHQHVTYPTLKQSKQCPGCGQEFRNSSKLMQHAKTIVHADKSGNTLTLKEFLSNHTIATSEKKSRPLEQREERGLEKERKIANEQPIEQEQCSIEDLPVLSDFDKLGEQWQDDGRFANKKWNDFLDLPEADLGEYGG